MSSWASQVIRIRQRTLNIPDVLTWLGVVQDDLRAGASMRKRAVHAYRRETLYPALYAYDNASFLSSVSADWPYNDFQGGVQVQTLRPCMRIDTVMINFTSKSGQ